MDGGFSAVFCDGVGEADGCFGFAQQQAVDEFDALHECVVCVCDFVFPHAESASGVDVVLFEPGDDVCEDVVAIDAWCWVGVVGVVVPGGDDVVSFAWFEQAGVFESFDGFFDDCGFVDGFVVACAGFAEE